ncbi:MAG: response regulator transcription factor [Janthinobacterium lividum]
MSLPLIAVIEDEEHLAQGLIFNLQAEGYDTHHEADGDAALRWLLAADPQPAAVLLDVMLPGRNGFSIVRALREAKMFVPVLLLTARGRAEDVVEGFDSGADDYLQKPFDLNVLLARLHALLRRVHWRVTELPSVLPQNETVQPDEANQTFTIGPKTVDFQSLEIRGGEQPVRLTVMEADLLRYLIERPGKVISRKELLEEVWRVQGDTDTRPIDNFIVRLRRYLEPQPAEPIYFLTVRGVGYRFVAPGT